MSTTKAEGSFTERAARLQAEMRERQAEREAGVRPRPTLWDRLVGLGWIAALGLAVLGVVGLLVVALVLSAGVILKLAGAVLVVVVASLAVQQIRGRDSASG